MSTCEPRDLNQKRMGGLATWCEVRIFIARRSPVRSWLKGSSRMAARKAISKRLRFSIFERDTFTCRYCGKQPPRVKLEIDHIVPVSKDGTNDESNLLTSCQACNAGKSDRLPKTSAPTESERLRMAQENLEQIDSAELAAAAMQAREDIRLRIADYWSELSGGGSLLRSNICGVANLYDEFGIEQVLEWLDLAFTRTSGSEYNTMRYLHGIARNVREDICP